MKVKKGKLNPGEIFPCAISAAKKVFGDTDVFLNFASILKDYGTFANTPDRFYVKHNVKGRILAAMYGKQCEEQMISFYRLKDCEYSDELKAEFEDKYLPEFYRLHKTLEDIGDGNRVHLMLVELTEHKLKLHEIKLHFK